MIFFSQHQIQHKSFEHCIFKVTLTSKKIMHVILNILLYAHIYVICSSCILIWRSFQRYSSKVLWKRQNMIIKDKSRLITSENVKYAKPPTWLYQTLQTALPSGILGMPWYRWQEAERLKSSPVVRSNEEWR